MYPNFSEVYSIIRKLSRSNYWQSIYSHSQEGRGLKIFDNLSDYTNLQVMFLNELSRFSSICMDVLLNEVSELVLKKETYQDAYLFYKNYKRTHKDKRTSTIPTTTTPIDKNYHKKEIVNQNQWVFTKVKGSK